MALKKSRKKIPADCGDLNVQPIKLDLVLEHEEDFPSPEGNVVLVKRNGQDSILCEKNHGSSKPRLCLFDSHLDAKTYFDLICRNRKFREGHEYILLKKGPEDHNFIEYLMGNFS